MTSASTPKKVEANQSRNCQYMDLKDMPDLIARVLINDAKRMDLNNLKTGSLTRKNNNH